MARGRMISKRISKSKKIAGLKRDAARVLYFMIYPHTDCEGRYSGDPEDIKEDCVQKLRNYSFQKVAELLQELQEIGLILWYEVDGIPYLEIIKFEDFQIGLRKDKEAPSIIPPPSQVGVSPSLDSPSIPLKIKIKYKLKEVKGRKEEKKHLMYFSFEDAKWINIKEEHVKGWKQAYPACDIIIELFKMREWLLANPNQAKSNYRRFIVNWLNSQQNKGGTRGIDKQKFSGIKEWYEGELEKGTHEAK